MKKQRLKKEKEKRAEGILAALSDDASGTSVSADQQLYPDGRYGDCV